MKDKSKERQIEKIRNHYKNHFDVQFLISEFDREREENQKLRERLKEELVWQDECLKLEEQLQSVQQDRDKLIECLLFYERLARGREFNDGGRRARTLLTEIGVTVE